jgi:hypothetical protein
MSRVTAAFVCALCDPDNPRPASIMCSNNCGRYVCSVHATPRKGPGSAMVCAACAEALGLIDKPKPKPVPEVRPLIEIPPEPAPTPKPVVEPQLVVETKPALVAEAAAYHFEPFVSPTTPAAAPAQATEEVTVITPAATPPIAPPAPKQEPVIIENVVPAAQQTASRYVTEPEPTPKSAASETVVSQRGNTLQVPKVTPTLGKPPQPIAPKPRKAQRAGEGIGSNLDWKLIGTIAATVVLGILGLLLIIIAIRGGV